MINIDIEEFSSEYEIDYCEFEGEVRSRYYISPSSEDDYTKETKDFLLEFLSKRNIYPIYITFESYNNFNKIVKVLNKEHILYVVRKAKNNQYPVFFVTVENQKSLELIIEETFHLATENQFFAISFADNITYKMKIFKNMMLGKKEIEAEIPHVIMKDDSTVIVIYHDGLGFNIFSNDKNYSTISELYKHISEGTFINSQEIINFVNTANNFCNLVEKAEECTLPVRLSKFGILLSEVYSAALQLPEMEPTDEKTINLEVNLPQFAGFDNFNYYWELFDPFKLEEAICGNLLDDILDIYLELKRGLIAFEDNSFENGDVVWYWRYGFSIHWGHHVVDALRVINKAINEIDNI